MANTATEISCGIAAVVGANVAPRLFRLFPEQYRPERPVFRLMTALTIGAVVAAPICVPIYGLGVLLGQAAERRRRKN